MNGDPIHPNLRCYRGWGADDAQEGDGRQRTTNPVYAWDQLGGALWRFGANPCVFSCPAVHAGAIAFWLIALTRVDLSCAHPFAGPGYVVMLIASWLLLVENISPLRLLGTLAAFLGSLTISRS
jgi:multidrug transporter EmrE-like cation transporter